MDSQLAPSNLPLIDFSNGNLRPGTNIWISTSKQVKNALENHGIFLATYDKISSEIKNSFHLALEEYHDLPKEQKGQFTPDKPYLGYLADQHATCELTAIGDPTSMEAIEGFTNLFFSSAKKDYVSAIMQSYSKQVAELHEVIIRMACECYGVVEYYESLRESLAYICRVNKYRAAKLDEKNVGLAPHTDLSFMTIVHQNQVNGLEVMSNDGSWIPVDIPPSAFTVFAGDALMAWSNGRIRSVLHRVTISSELPRYSIGLFCYKKGMLEAPEQLVDEHHPLLFKPFDNLELVSLVYTERVVVVEDKLKVLLALKESICPS
ncbi:probable 2-oxoglutarate-dependent dioxygenase AOP1 [Coffea arabica]|uniref:Probable 2-oxoglutarate-dependent dioxygenase AOP1 n=1 Tax=Coffea arabica TaxID=13443 RepID=A0A6P6WQ27_COFAR